jgi:hypothetical protein
LTPWKRSVIQCDGVVTLARGEDASWVDMNLTELKIKKIHVVDSTAINGR